MRLRRLDSVHLDCKIVGMQCACGKPVRVKYSPIVKRKNLCRQCYDFYYRQGYRARNREKLRADKIAYLSRPEAREKLRIRMREYMRRYRRERKAGSFDPAFTDSPT